MIPRTIHYVWVGGKPLPDLVKRCIESWKEKLPDFKIKLWNEENSPMNTEYVRSMYEKKLWAFVSDYIRFWVLENEGGIYLDTDTLVLKHFDDALLEQTFFGKTPDGFIGCGVIGAPAHDPFIKAVREYYDKPGKDISKSETSPMIVTKIFNELKPAHVKIFPTEYFNPCGPVEKRTPEKLALAYTDNLWAESWISFKPLRTFARKMRIMPLIKGFFQKIGLFDVVQNVLK